MEKKEKNFDEYYILHGEKSPQGLGLLAQIFTALFRYLIRRSDLTIGDAKTLRDIHNKTGISFPLKGEDFRPKK